MAQRKKPGEQPKYGRDAAREVERARRMLKEARHSLATARRSAHAPPYVFAGRWRQANAALEDHRAALSRIPGVVGHAIGYRVQKGVETDEECVVVFVRRKKSKAIIKRSGAPEIPSRLHHGKTPIEIDVVEIGRRRPQAGLLHSIGRVGLQKFGTVGAIGRDLDTGRRALITAMHVFGKGNFGALPGQGLPVASPKGGGRIGELILGTTNLVDAAKILLDDGASISPPLPTIGARPISNDVNTVGKMFGAASKKTHSGVIKYLNFNDVEKNLVNTLLVSIPSIDGDSGSGLIDTAGFLLGFLFGEAPAGVGNLRVFCPAERIFPTLRFTIP